MDEIKLTIHPFEMGTERESAIKVQEEANEAVHAWRSLVNVLYPVSTAQEPNTCMLSHARNRLADEIADVIQAACNLAARYNIDLQAAMERCERRNRERGRYGDAKSCGGNDCDCGGDCGAVPDGDDAPKSPEEMSAEELIEALYLANGYRGNGDGYCEDGSCTKTLGVDWCGIYHTCRICRKHLLDLLETAYKQEKEGLRCEESYLADEIVKRDMEIEHVKKRCVILSDSYYKTVFERAQLERQVVDLTHERDGLRNRLAELNESGITRLHRLLRETLGEAKNITHNARVYINKQQGSKDERCGDCGSDRRDHGGVCGVERVGEHLLSEEPPAQEMSERERVVERLRGYAVYMAEPPSENASRLLACITGNKDARIACKDDIESTRDKLIELLGGVNDAG